VRYGVGESRLLARPPDPAARAAAAAPGRAPRWHSQVAGLQGGPAAWGSCCLLPTKPTRLADVKSVSILPARTPPIDEIRRPAQPITSSGPEGAAHTAHQTTASKSGHGVFDRAALSATAPAIPYAVGSAVSGFVARSKGGACGQFLQVPEMRGVRFSWLWLVRETVTASLF
jgi:hypothetical protein